MLGTAKLDGPPVSETDEDLDLRVPLLSVSSSDNVNATAKPTATVQVSHRCRAVDATQPKYFAVLACRSLEHSN
jgi:hypothetical protein